MEVADSYETAVDRITRGEEGVEGIDRTGIDKDGAIEASRKLIEHLGRYDYEVHRLNELVVIRVRLGRFNVLIVPLGYRRILTGWGSLKIFEAIRDLLIEDSKNVIIYYTPGGKLLTSAYLFLGHLIEKHKLGILFVNGGPDEIVDVLESLSEKGEFIPRDEDYVNVRPCG